MAGPRLIPGTEASRQKVTLRARMTAMQMLEVLLELAQTSRDDRVRFQAASAVLDRAYGRAAVNKAPPVADLSELPVGERVKVLEKALEHEREQQRLEEARDAVGEGVDDGGGEPQRLEAGGGGVRT